MDIVKYMVSENTVIMVPVTIVLAWFIIGVLLGKRLHHRQGSRFERNQGRRSRQAVANGNTEIYVGNLSYDMSENDLRKEFEKYGKVASVRIIENKMNGKSKGFGFVEMSDKGEAASGIRAVNGKELKGRRVVVNEAQSQARNG